MNPPHTKLVGASPLPRSAAGAKSDVRPGIQREKTVDGAGRKVAVIGDAAAMRHTAARLAGR